MLAIVAVVIMSVYVLPKFKDFYRGLDANLPLPTRMLLNFTTSWRTGGGSSSPIVGVLVLIVSRVFGGKRGKQRRDTLLLRLPVIGPLVHLVAVERFCRVLAALVHTGVTAARRRAGRRPTAPTTACSRASSPSSAKR